MLSSERKYVLLFTFSNFSICLSLSDIMNSTHELLVLSEQAHWCACVCVFNQQKRVGVFFTTQVFQFICGYWFPIQQMPTLTQRFSVFLLHVTTSLCRNVLYCIFTRLTKPPNVTHKYNCCAKCLLTLEGMFNGLPEEKRLWLFCT